MFSSEIAGGQLQCVHSGSSGGYNYLMLYNNDNSTDGSTYYQFVCLVSMLVNIYKLILDLSRTLGRTCHMSIVKTACYNLYNVFVLRNSIYHSPDNHVKITTYCLLRRQCKIKLILDQKPYVVI